MSRRFFAPPENLDSLTGHIVLPDDEARHLRNVLRLRAGDEVFVFDGAGREYRGTVTENTARRVTIAPAESVPPAQPESPLNLTLALALLKGDKFDWVVQKATELGLKRLVPIQTQHADVRLRDVRDGVQRVARWQRIALAAAKQSGRAFIPEIVECVSFADFLTDVSHETSARFMFTERSGQGLHAAMQQAGRPISATLLVGAEGGWANEEIAAAQNAGWRLVTLGGRILRAETAALVAVTLLQHLWGDLR